MALAAASPSGPPHPPGRQSWHRHLFVRHHPCCLRPQWTPLPDDAPCQQGTVILAASHNSTADIIKPRLQAAGGDPSQVLLLTTVEQLDPQNVRLDDRPFSLSEDLDLLEAAIQRLHATLVIIDPLTAVLGYPSGSSRRSKERGVVSRLAQLARNTGCAILLVRPLSKRPTATTLCAGGSGSPDLITAVSSRLLIVPDPDDEESYLLVTTKHSLSKSPSILVYQVIAQDQHTPSILFLGDHPGPTSAVLNSGVDTPLSEMRQLILEYLHDSPSPVDAREYTDLSRQDYESVRKMFQRMHHAGQLVSPARGLYTTPDNPCLAQYPSGATTDSSESPVPSVPSVPNRYSLEFYSGAMPSESPVMK